RRPANGPPDIFFLPGGMPGHAGPADYLSLTEICGRLARTRAGKIVVILDLAFGPKTLRSEGEADAATVEEARTRLLNLVSGRGGFFLLMADDGSGEALEIGAWKSGLFTRFLLDALKNGKDRVMDLRKEVRAAVIQESSLRARTQTPVIAGASTESVK
ncbi:MAG: hypothetical protein MUC63_01115, partial [Planctomycetes bacterium]|nr:hypothetical protein [Planctomycetota bacterium]